MSLHTNTNTHTEPLRENMTCLQLIITVCITGVLAVSSYHGDMCQVSPSVSASRCILIFLLAHNAPEGMYSKIHTALWSDTHIHVHTVADRLIRQQSVRSNSEIKHFYQRCLDNINIPALVPRRTRSSRPLKSSNTL